MHKPIRQIQFRFFIGPLITMLLLSACSSNENSQTTATTVVPPPRRQTLTVVGIPPEAPTQSQLKDVIVEDRPGVDRTKPLLVFNLQDGKTFQVGEVVVVEFALLNAKLKGEGGEYRVRYFVDDDDPLWLDSSKPIGLAGWMPGPHTIRLELIGPDGWPFRNGDQNIAIRKIVVSPP